MTNPKRKRKNVSVSRRRRRRNPVPWQFKQRSASRPRRRARRSNPYGFSRRRRSNYRRNPVITGYSFTDLAKVGISAAAGGYGTRALTQLVLQSNNTGWMGYAANGAISLLLGWAADKFLGKDYGIGVVAGGLSATAIRVWTEQVSQTSPSQLSGMGDLDFSSNGMGDYISSPYPLPTVSQKNPAGVYINQNPWAAALPAPAPAAPTGAPAAAAKGMGMMVARNRPRWA